MRILGIDPGLATMGYGVIEAEGQKRKVVQFGTINTRAGSPTPQRLRSIFQGVNQLLDIYAPDDVAFEELFFSKNVTTGIAVAQMSPVVPCCTPTALSAPSAKRSSTLVMAESSGTMTTCTPVA